jgi:hypothetical protein
MRTATHDRGTRMFRRRITRRMPWSRVPLRRRSDQIQAWLNLAVVMAMLVIAPWAGWRAASTAYLSEARANEWERQHHRPVVATLSQDAPVRSAAGGEAVPASETVSVPATWTGPDGLAHTSTVSVVGGTRAGSTVTVWVDDRGTLVPPPRRRNAGVDALVAGLLTVIALAAFLAGVRRIAVWRLDRRRLRSWEAEWQIVGPGWSRR